MLFTPTAPPVAPSTPVPDGWPGWVALLGPAAVAFVAMLVAQVWLIPRQTRRQEEDRWRRDQVLAIYASTLEYAEKLQDHALNVHMTGRFVRPAPDNSDVTRQGVLLNLASDRLANLWRNVVAAESNVRLLVLPKEESFNLSQAEEKHIRQEQVRYVAPCADATLLYRQEVEEETLRWRGSRVRRGMVAYRRMGMRLLQARGVLRDLSRRVVAI